MTLTRQDIANILHHADRFTLANGTDELYIRRDDITNDFLALVNGYKSIGGDVYVTQTFDLRSVCFDMSERNTAIDFMSWVLTVVKQ